jgi:hypothetical protein
MPQGEKFMGTFSIIWLAVAVESASKFNRFDTCDAVLLEDSRGRGRERITRECKCV